MDIDYKLSYRDTPKKQGSNEHCGCTEQNPHSHLVIGHECPCEKGARQGEEVIKRTFET